MFNEGAGEGVSMHPVQAAPRQSAMPTTGGWPTADAPRAGSAEAKEQIMREYGYSSRMHPVQAAHSEIIKTTG